MATRSPAAASPLVAVTGEEELLAQMAADAGAGFEEATRDAFAIPFLVVLQDLSPQVKKKMAGYVEGARPGMIYNTVTKELYEELRVIPCYFSQTYIEWIPRGKGDAGKGGFIAAHPVNTPLLAKVTRDGPRNVLPNGHELQDTRQHFVLFVRPDGTADQAMIAMKSTQLKVSRRWMAQMRAAQITINGRLIEAPSFAWSYVLRSEEEANDQGSWYAWEVGEREQVADPLLYQRARAFCSMMREGKVKINYEEDPSMQHAAAAADPRASSSSPPPAAVGDDFGNDLDDLDDDEIEA
jgi:hypothetical protein